MFQEQLQNLSKREQYYLLVLVIFLCVFSIYQFYLSPKHTKITNLKTDIIAKQELLAWMQHAKKNLPILKKQSNPSSAQSSNGAILTIVEITLNQGTLSAYNKTVRQQSQDRVTVTFTEVPFVELLDWIKTIWQEHHIEVNKLSVTQTDKPGVIKAIAQLKRA